MFSHIKRSLLEEFKKTNVGMVKLHRKAWPRPWHRPTPPVTDITNQSEWCKGSEASAKLCGQTTKQMKAKLKVTHDCQHKLGLFLENTASCSSENLESQSPLVQRELRGKTCSTPNKESTGFKFQFFCLLNLNMQYMCSYVYLSVCLCYGALVFEAGTLWICSTPIG